MLQSRLTQTRFGLFAFATAITMALGSVAVGAESVPTAPKKMTYKSAQGEVDLTKIETMMSGRLGAKVEVTSMRWSHDPLDYVDYILGGIRSATPHLEEYQVATYVLSVRIADEHDAACLVQLNVNMNTGRISTCESKTSRVIFFKDFAYGDIGLPGQPVTKRWYPDRLSPNPKKKN